MEGLRDPDWAERSTCKYCTSFVEDSRGDVDYCANMKSPNYNFTGKSEPLKISQEIVGCKEINYAGKYDGKKIPAHFFKWVPKESFLRTLPPEQVLEDPGKKYLEPEHTIKEFKAFWGKHW